MPDDRASRFWDAEINAQSHVSWLAHPAVRRYVNTLVSGDPDRWPMDFFQEFLGGRTFKRALSIGCGGGPLERDLIRRGICDSIDAFDGSPVSISQAREEAVIAGCSDRIDYRVDDFNECGLPRACYDAAFFHQSLHHVTRLERLLDEVWISLRPDGLLYIDEYIGPSRTEWSDARIAMQRALFSMLLPEEKLRRDLPLPIQEDDPSEAVRSGEILEQVISRFEIVAFRDYGGDLLSVLFPAIKGSDEVVARLIEAERQWRIGRLVGFHAVVIARRRKFRGLPPRMRRYLGRLRRFLWPIQR